jgi:hypothetical protein
MAGRQPYFIPEVMMDKHRTEPAGLDRSEVEMQQAKAAIRAIPKGCLSLLAAIVLIAWLVHLFVPPQYEHLVFVILLLVLFAGAVGHLLFARSKRAEGLPETAGLFIDETDNKAPPSPVSSDPIEPR